MKGEQCLHSYLIILRACSNNSAFLESPSFIPTIFFSRPRKFPLADFSLPLKVLHRHSLALSKCSTESLFAWMNVFVLPLQAHYKFPHCLQYPLHITIPLNKFFLPGCHLNNVFVQQIETQCNKFSHFEWGKLFT